MDQYTIIFDKPVKLPGQDHHKGSSPEFEQAIIRAQFSPKLF